MTQQQSTTLERPIPKKYREIQEGLKSSDRKAKFVMYLFADGPREYDFLLKIWSLGRDSYWRREIIKRAGRSAAFQNSTTPTTTKSGRGKIRVLDLACGPGTLTFDFARSMGNAGEVVAVDITREMLARALELHRRSKETNVDFIQARAENLPLRESAFDCATISLATRNISSVRVMLAEMRRCVREGGIVESMDFTKPKGRVFVPFYRFYIFNLLPTLGFLISRHWNGILAYLANSIQRSKSPEEIAKLMKEVGLAETRIKRMTHGTTALVSGVK